jgi:DNA-binding GntR family transcriptional regulator
VTGLSPRKIDEIYTIVGALEGLAAREAASYAQEPELRALEDLLSEMHAAIAKNDPTEYVRRNARFHAIIISAGKNESLKEGIDRYRIVMRHYRNVALALPGRMRESVAEHEQILAALRAKDGEAAESAMRRHMEQARRTLATIMAAAFSSTDLAPWVHDDASVTSS